MGRIIEVKATKKVKVNVSKLVREKEKRLKEYRKEATRLMSMANKRLKRLEKNGLTDTPAYQQFLEGGTAKFSVKGKDYNELQQEVSRMNKFINSQTSTVRGVNKTLKDMASNTGIKYKNLTELRSKAKQFFELASKVEQYLRTVNDMASAIGYQKIWQAVNTYTEEVSGSMDLADMDIESAIKKISDSLAVYDEVNPLAFKGSNETIGWFKLKKN